MERKVTDRGQVEWSCVRAYAGVAETTGSGAASEAMSRTIGRAGTVPVVCTPSREEATVRLELPEGWAEELSDEELLQALEQARGKG